MQKKSYKSFAVHKRFAIHDSLTVTNTEQYWVYYPQELFINNEVMAACSNEPHSRSAAVRVDN